MRCLSTWPTMRSVYPEQQGPKGIFVTVANAASLGQLPSLY